MGEEEEGEGEEGTIRRSRMDVCSIESSQTHIHTYNQMTDRIISFAQNMNTYTTHTKQKRRKKNAFRKKENTA